MDETTLPTAPDERPDVITVADGLTIYGTPAQRASLFGALAKAQGAFLVPERTETVKITMKSGGTYVFSYAPLENLVAAAKDGLSSNGLAFPAPFARPSVAGDVSLISMLTHADGAMMVTIFKFIQAGDIKDFGGQLTYLTRYSYRAVLCLPSGEPDADSLPSQERGETGAETAKRDRQQPPAAARKAEPTKPPAEAKAPPVKVCARCEQPITVLGELKLSTQGKPFHQTCYDAQVAEFRAQQAQARPIGSAQQQGLAAEAVNGPKPETLRTDFRSDAQKAAAEPTFVRSAIATEGHDAPPADDDRPLEVIVDGKRVVQDTDLATEIKAVARELRWSTVKIGERFAELYPQGAFGAMTIGQGRGLQASMAGELKRLSGAVGK